jgi:hypothetical protein
MATLQDILNNFTNNSEFKTDNSVEKASRRKKVYQFNSEGIFLCEYKSILIASKETGILKQNIMDALKGKTKFSQGYFWSTNRYEKFDVNCNYKSSLSYVVYDTTGALVDKFQTQQQIREKLNLNSGSVSLVLKGKRPHTKGFVIKYEK